MANSSKTCISTDTENETTKCMMYKFNSSCGLLSSALTRTPLFSPFFKPNNNNNNSCRFNLQSPVVVPNVVRDFHESIVSTAEKCFRFVENLASENPFVSKIMSVHSDFRNFSQSQMRCRNTQKLNFLSNHNFAAIIPGDSVGGLVAANGILNFLNLYNTILVVRLVLTWFPNSPPAIVTPLSMICDPYLNIFRGLIPPLGGTLDLSPILAFLVLNALTSTASALPAELPSSIASLESTSSQEKWIRRLDGQKPKSSASIT